MNASLLLALALIVSLVSSCALPLGDDNAQDSIEIASALLDHVFRSESVARTQILFVDVEGLDVQVVIRRVAFTPTKTSIKTGREYELRGGIRVDKETGNPCVLVKLAVLRHDSNSAQVEFR